MMQVWRRRLISTSSRVDRASATKSVTSGSIPGRVKPKTINIVRLFRAFLLDVQQQKRTV